MGRRNAVSDGVGQGNGVCLPQSAAGQGSVFAEQLFYRHNVQCTACRQLCAECAQPQRGYALEADACRIRTGYIRRVWLGGRCRMGRPIWRLLRGHSLQKDAGRAGMPYRAADGAGLWRLRGAVSAHERKDRHKRL